jgi:hypothetical protein
MRPLVVGASLVVLAALALAARVQLGHWRDSETLFRHSLAVTERNHVAHAQLGLALVEAGRAAEGIAELHASVRIRPDALEVANNLAWLLATHPDPALRDPEEAVRIARAAARQAGGWNPQVLDTLAAAHAAAGRFDRARWYAGRALRVAAASGDAPLVDEIRARLDLYRDDRPYRETPGPIRRSAAPAP